ncbi:MAG: hypothetical protein EBV06_15495 [Planctomycetia bacterium]|nr:hypothetical protein [Planctomycetia bacterium]
MLSEFRSQRNLSNWLELDYHHRRRLLPGWSWWLLGGLLLGLVSLVGLYAASGDRAFQAGPVSRPHAMFNNDCSKCHTNNGSTFSRLWLGDSVGSVSDEACLKCHTGAIHNKHSGPVGHCVLCHKEHRGHDALVRQTDATCTRCHQDLKAVYPETKHANRVTAFDPRNHPPFPKLTDSGTIKFNHSAHLKPEEGLLTGRGPNGEKVTKKLSCSDCHVAEDDGRTMKPVTYEKHCQSCHPLGINLVEKCDDPERLKLATKFKQKYQPRLDHPHSGQSAAVVRASIRDSLTRFILDPAHAGFLGGESPPPRALADRSYHVPNKAVFEWVNTQMVDVERILFDGPGGCKYCHTVNSTTADGLPVVALPQIASRWWKGARFSHDPHRSMQCQECHPAQASTKTSDVLIPSQDLCVRCHRPSGGAGAGCTECHVFHDEALQRAGRAERDLQVDWLLKRGR